MDILINKEILYKEKLPGIDAHKRIYPDVDRYNFPNDYQSSSVLACIFNSTRNPELLFIRRSPQGKHGGQIAFPGGKKELDDLDLVQTCKRESFEEVGLKKVDVIRALTPVYIPVSKYMMQSYLGVTEQEKNSLVTNHEVSEVFFLPLEKLKTLELKETTVKTKAGSMNVNAFEYDGWIIWGATSMVLSEIQLLFEKI